MANSSLRAPYLKGAGLLAMTRILVAMSYSLSLTGCSEIQAPTAAEAMSHPFGTGAPFTLGTTKSKVLESWGKPKHVVVFGVDELGSAREEWIYEGWLPGLPIDHEYVSRTKHLFFEGENLVRWKEQAPPGAEPPSPTGK